MTEQQLDMYDAVTPVPPLWDCRKTCRRFGENVDSPEWWFGEKRCLLCTDPHLHVSDFDNCCQVWCDLYGEEAKA